MTRAEFAAGKDLGPALAGRVAALDSRVVYFALFVLAHGGEADRAALGRALDAADRYAVQLAEARAEIRAERSRAGPGTATAPGPISPEAARPETRKPLRPPSPTIRTVSDGGRPGQARGDGGKP